VTRYDFPSAGGRDRDDRAGRRAYRAGLGLGAAGGELIADPEPTGGRRRLAPKAVPNANQELWAPIGPSSSLRGQPADEGRVSGRVVDIAFEPTTGRRGYAASATGGVWFTDDGGSSWRALGGWIPAPTAGGQATISPLSCGALMVEFPDANDAGQDVVWVGTGENRDVVVDVGAPGKHLTGIGVLRGVGPATKSATDNTAFTIEATNLSGVGCFRMITDAAGTVVVATTAGLFERPAGAGPHATWTRAANHPMSTPTAPASPEPLRCVDLLRTPAIGATVKARLWAVFVDTDRTIDLRVREPGAATFTSVLLIDETSGVAFVRSGIAAVAASGDGRVVWVLGQQPARLLRIDATATPLEGRQIKDTPPVWPDEKESTKIAIGVDPTDATRVAVGGTSKKGSPRAASLYVGAVTPSGASFKYPSVAASFSGDFVHPDVLAIRFSPDGATVWVATDGGVYRSRARGANGTFVAKNDGLAVLECGFVVCHPEHDGGVVIGLQDNGTQRRVGETVWRLDSRGDGGGLAFDLANPHRYVAQNVHTDWDHGNSPLYPVRRKDYAESNFKKEDDASLFYSAPSTIAKDATTTQLAIGTNRVWYTEDWGVTWRTLEKGVNTNTDARPKKEKGKKLVVNETLDVLPGGSPKIRACRWETPDRLWVMTSGSLHRFERDSAGQWSRTTQAVHPVLSRRGKKGRIIGDTPASGPAAKNGTWLDLAIHTSTTAAGKLGTLYLATTGDPSVSDADQLFWFDGTSTWRSAGLRSKTTAAALAVTVEPGHPELVYVGTTIGVFRGTLEMDDGTPEWTWTRLDNGLPDVAVHDLAIHTSPDVRLLRAATQARGVWELDLGGAVTPQTYLRVHELDSRRRSPTPLGRPFTAKVPSTVTPGAMVPVDYAWHASPDIRVHPRLQVIPAPSSLPWTIAKGKDPTDKKRPTDTWRLWQFQAALRALDGRVEPNGKWTKDRFEEVLKRNGATLSGGKRAVTSALWTTVMTAANVAALPWDGARPSEGDLIEWLPTIGDTLAADGPSCAVPAGPATLQVLVHDRGFPATPADKVRVALLQFAFGPLAGQKSSAWVPGNVGWTAAVTAFLRNGTVPTLPPGWTLIPGTTSAAARPLAPVAAGEPQSISFDVDFTGAAAGNLFLIVAVVSSEKDLVTLVEQPLPTLTVGNHHVAVRSVKMLAP
jgi:hypothetical protein